MARKHWTLDEIPWERLEPARVDADLVKIVKAAALVELNGNDYAAYLCNVFHDDPAFRQAALDWAEEEVQHGRALGRWAMLIDPEWDIDRANRRFLDIFRVRPGAGVSARGSRSGELIARCMVETGTSSYYLALGDAVEEPVLKAISRNIAADEVRHYKLFHRHLGRYLEREGLGRLARLRIALSRIRESEDDELASAYWAANAPEDAPYDHRTFMQAYVRRALAYYRPDDIEHVVVMIFKAVGLRPRSILSGVAARVAWRLVDRRRRTLAKATVQGQGEGEIRSAAGPPR